MTCPPVVPVEKRPNATKIVTGIRSAVEIAINWFLDIAQAEACAEEQEISFWHADIRRLVLASNLSSVFESFSDELDAGSYRVYDGLIGADNGGNKGAMGSSGRLQINSISKAEPLEYL